MGVRGIFIHANSSLQRASTTMGLNSLDSFFNKLVVRAFVVLCSTVKSARSLELRICPLKISAFTIKPVCVCVCVCVCMCYCCCCVCALGVRGLGSTYLLTRNRGSGAGRSRLVYRASYGWSPSDVKTFLV